MDAINSIVIVFLSGIVELWLAIPLGFALKLSPINTAFFSALGSITAVLIVSSSGANLRERFLKWRYSSRKDVKKGRLYNIWNNYGVVGLGLLSPLFFGAPLGAALGIVLGARRNPLIIWMIMGIVIWSIGLTSAIYFGFLTVSSYI